ncbi:MAG: hypothetical protein QXX95_03665 [Nitrososphaerales archaeon]
MGSSVIISEAYLTIAVVIAASILVSSFSMGLIRVQDFQREQLDSYKEKMDTQIKIIYAHAKVGNNTIIVWVKNIGLKSLPLSLITESTDIFFGNITKYLRVKYNDPSTPKWTLSIENDLDSDGRWDPKETIKVVITWVSNLSVGDYVIRIVTYAGTEDEYTFSL